MRLRKGKTKYKFPKLYSQILYAYVLGNQPHNWLSFALMRVSPRDLERNKEPAMPTRFAIYLDELEFSPPPDHPYEVRIRFLPPAEEY